MCLDNFESYTDFLFKISTHYKTGLKRAVTMPFDMYL